MVSIRQAGRPFRLPGRLPTAEVYAPAYKALGVPVYSSAVFNFIPTTALRFYARVAATTATRPPARRVLPALPGDPQPRRGYAVSIVKAGARIVGHGAGPVRPPLTDLSESETRELAKLIEARRGASASCG
jgi:5-dehydro-4-deoxyglucarate dehydratase